MPNPKPNDGQRNLSLERFEKALLWKVDQLKGPKGCNRTRMIQGLVWDGLKARYGISKWDVRAEYASQSGGDSVEA